MTPRMIREMVWGDAQEPDPDHGPALHSAQTSPLHELITDSISDPGANPHSKLFSMRDLLRQELSGSRAKIKEIPDQVDVRIDAIIDAEPESSDLLLKSPSVVELIEEVDALNKRERQLSWSLAGGVAFGAVLVLTLLLVVGPDSDTDNSTTGKGNVPEATASKKRDAVNSSADPVSTEKGSAQASQQQASQSAAGALIAEAPAPSPRGAGARLPMSPETAGTAKTDKTDKTDKGKAPRAKKARANKHRKVRRRWARWARKRWRARAKRRKARLAFAVRRLDQRLLRNPYP